MTFFRNRIQGLDTMIRIAICENDSLWMETEKNLIESFFLNKKVKVKIVTYKSCTQLIEEYTNSFNIIFLDIENDKDINGIDAAKWLRDKETKAHIILISAFAEYMQEGYEVGAHRYLLKNDTNFEDKFQECMDSVLIKIREFEEVIEFEVTGGILNTVPSRILYAESKVHRVIIYTLEQSGDLKEYYMYDRLDNVQTKLEEYGFLRIHQSYLINGEYLRNVYRYTAELSNGIGLPISKKYYSNIEKYYKA